ncbi:MAG TPA: SRPBCC domain-containing protein [Acidimicrobiales bacterium]
MLANLVTMAASGTFRRYRARQDVLRGLHAALGDSTKWRPADDLPDRVLADTSTRPVVVASVDVETDQVTTFAAFTDPAIYSRWLGVPVMIDDGHFDCTMGWGTRVRGVYELECPPELIVMRWDLEDDNVSIPGGEMTGYLRVEARDSGAHVEVHQLVDTPRQADFMEAAWGLVLGRLKKGVLAASNPAVLIRPRARRAKRRPSA